jgi:hypothetical protein
LPMAAGQPGGERPGGVRMTWCNGRVTGKSATRTYAMRCAGLL